MQFCEYTSMLNYHNVVNALKKFDENNKDKISWYATEKIHGTNYSLLCDGFSVLPCKRTSELNGEKDATFFNHTTILNKYKNDVLTIFNYIKLQNLNVTQIQLFGELFGGNYGGVHINNSKCVQKKMNYHPDNEFMCFDLLVTVTNKSNYPNESFYYDFEKLIELLKKIKSHDNTFSLKMVPIIANGTLTEMLNLNVENDSVVSSHFNIDFANLNIDDSKIKKISEGYVIRTNNEMYYENKNHKYRTIFKYKNKYFLEIKCGEENINTNQNSLNKKVNTNVNAKTECINKMSLYITDARYENVYSKLSEDEQNDNNTIIVKMYKDIEKDFIIDHTDIESGKIDEIYNINNINSNAIKGKLKRFIEKMKKRK